MPTTKKYWNEFFQKWGYQEQQKRDIANVMKKVLEDTQLE